MPLGAVTVGVFPDVGVGFVGPAVLGSTLLGSGVLVAVRMFRSRSPFLAFGCLLGCLGVGTQLVLAAEAPASRVAFLCGVLGGACLYGAGVGLLPERRVGRQWLAVGSGIWVAGTITVTISLTAARWPHRWSLPLGVVLPAVPGVLSWLRGEWRPRRNWRILAGGVLGGVFVLPVAIDSLFGEEVLFVAYLAATVVGSLLWWFSRLAGY